jgi:HK97 family phage major capsid protein
MKTLAERIIEAENGLVGTKDALVAATKALEASPDEDSLLHEVEQLTTQVEKATASIDALKKAENVLAARAAPAQTVDDRTGAPSIITQRSKSGQADNLFWQMGAAAFLSHVQRKSIQEILAERYPNEKALPAAIAHITKAGTNPATTFTPGWAAELVEEGLWGFLDAITETSVAAALASRSLRLSFGGYNSLKVPRRNEPGPGQTEPAWVGEGGVIPVTQYSFGASTIDRYKLAAITSMTREIAERSTPAIEGILRSALRDSYSTVLDNALLSNGAAVAGIRPAGLLNGVAALPATPGGGEDAIRGDVKALLVALTSARSSVSPVLMMNNVDRLVASMVTSALSESVFATELAAGRLLGLPVISSANVPRGRLVMVDAAVFAAGFDAPEYDVSDVATIVEADAGAGAPTHANTLAGALGTPGQVPRNGGIDASGNPAGAASAGYTARSFWQTYSVGIRMIAPTSWSLLRPDSVVWIDGITW